MVCRILVAATGLAILTACSASDDASNGGPATHLYVASADTSIDGGGALLVYDLPLTASSVPSVTLPLKGIHVPGVGGSTLAVTSGTGVLNFFHLPLTASSTPYAAFQAGSSGGTVFDQSGHLFQGGSGVIDRYSPPFTSASVSDSTILTPGITASQVAMAPDGTIYDGEFGFALDVVKNGQVSLTFHPPLPQSVRGLAANGTQLANCAFEGTANQVYLYATPISSASVPVVTMDLPSDFVPESCTFDANGKLYVGGFNGGTVGRLAVFTPPFGGSSVATVTLQPAHPIVGVVVGQL